MPAARLAPFLLLMAILPAQRHLLDTLPQDAEARELCGFVGHMVPFDLPGRGEIRGLATIGSDRARVVWLLRGAELMRLAWPSLQLEHQVETEVALRGLCTDGRFLYSLGEGEIVVLDPIAGRPVSTRPLDTGPTPSALGWHAGALFVASGRDLRRLGEPVADPDADLKATESQRITRDPVHWLCSDGSRLWAGSRAELRPVDTDVRAAAVWNGGRWPVRIDAGAAVWIGGALLLAAEYRDARQQRHVLCGLWTPKPPPAADRIVVHFTRGAAGEQWLVGESRCWSLRQLRSRLLRLASDRRVRVTGADGSLRVMPIVLEAGIGATVRQLGETWDVARSVGFSEISSPAQEAWARDRVAWARTGLQPVDR